MIIIRRVEGESMLPALKPGKIVIARRTRDFREGQVVIAFVDGLEVIKRIKKINNSGIYLKGDNSDKSIDSRSYGYIMDSKIEGVVVWPRDKYLKKFSLSQI